MNSKATKILALSIAITLISIAGYFVGQSLRPDGNNTIPPQEEPQIAIEQDIIIEEEKTKPLTKFRFTAINPNYGPIVTTEPINVQYGDDVAFTTVSDNLVDKLRTGQQVILLDKENYVLPLGGEVTAIEDRKITVKLPEGTTTELLNDRLFVMTNVFKNVKRIPLSAIMQNENGIPFVWIAYSSGDGYEVFPQPVSNDTSAQNEELIQANHKISIDDLVITNPNEQISSDYRYTIDVIEFEAPLHDPIKQAWIDYELYRLDEQQKRMIKAAMDCKHRVGPVVEGIMSTDASTSTSCGGHGLPTDPMDIFREILSHIPPSALE